MAQLTNEVLATTSSTLVPRTNVTRAVSFLNLGPNNIWICVGAPAVANKCERVATYDRLSFDVGSDTPIYILASTANQVTGAATIVTELP